MSGSVNRVMLIGNLGSDPEVKHMQSGKSVANFRIATSESWKDRDGEKQEKTEWHNCQVWTEGLLKVVDKYLHKGDKVYVEGKLQTRKWQDQDGKDRYSTEVVVSNMTMLTTKGNGDGRDDSRSRDDDGGSRSEGRSARRGDGGRAASRQEDLDDSIPF